MKDLEWELTEMRSFAAILFCVAATAIPGFGQESERHFSDYPAVALHMGPTARLRFSQQSDERYRTLVQRAIGTGTNFAGHYTLVRFRIGKGPIGVLVVDLTSGMVFRLPSDTVQDGLYLYDACLERYRVNQQVVAGDQSDSFALAYRPDSELMIVMSCTDFTVARSYYWWHDQKWKLIERTNPRPPPPAPVPSVSYLHSTCLTPPYPIR
jgi:hypothetical protein